MGDRCPSIRAAVAADGQLWFAPFAGNVWVSQGTSKICKGCGEPVAEAEQEFEVDASDVLVFRFHAECYNAWMTFGGDGQ